MSAAPTSRYDGVVERTPTGGVVRFERHLPYAIADVWDAVTNPERLAEWWLPFPANISVDLREGGSMDFVASGDEPVEVHCTILQLNPPTLLEHTHFEPESRMRWELQSVETGTVLRLTYFGPDADQAIANNYVAGLHTSLGRLEPSIVGQPIEWDWAEFAATQAAYHGLGFAAAPEPPAPAD